MQNVIQVACQPYNSKRIWPTAWLIDSDDSAREIRNRVKKSVREVREKFNPTSRHISVCAQNG